MSRVVVRRIGEVDWTVFRDLRIAALADAPEAFGSRLADWRDASDQQWIERVNAADVNYIAFLDHYPVGMVSGFRLPGSQDTAELTSMWVSPQARGRSVGDLLVRSVASWASQSGYDRVVLDVREWNTSALALYERNGFAKTPLVDQTTMPDGTVVVEFQMELDLRRP